MIERSTRTPRRSTRIGRAALTGLAVGGLLLTAAPAASAAPVAATASPVSAQRLAPTTRTASVHVHFAPSASYLTTYSQKILDRFLDALPDGATVVSTRVVGFVQARTAYDNGRALGAKRAAEVRSHLRELGLTGRVDIAAGGIAGADASSRRAVVTVTYRMAIPQTIDFAQPDAMTVGDDDQPLTATASSGLRVTVRSSTAEVCTVLGTADAPVVHAVSAGECALLATQPGNAYVGAASPVARTLTIDPVHISPPAPASYVVTFDAGAGVTVPDPTTWTDGDDALVLPTPTRDGYTFDGWFAAVDGDDLVGLAGADYTPAEDVTLYAHWTAVPAAHVVTFHANFADAPADTTQESDGSAALTANPFVNPTDGLTFAGWATEAGGAVVYADGATYDFAADEDLYAVWGFAVDITSGFMNQTVEVYYCDRADGQCATPRHLTIGQDAWRTTVVVFPNQSADGSLGGYDISVTATWGAATCGQIYVEGGENQTWYNGAGTVRFDVQSSGHIHLDMP